MGDDSATDLRRSWLTGDPLVDLHLDDDEQRGEYNRVHPVTLLDKPGWAPWLGAREPYGELLRRVRDSVAHHDAVLEFPYDWRLSAGHNARLLVQAATRHLQRWTAHPASVEACRLAGRDAPSRLAFVAHASGGLVACSALIQDAELARSTRTLVCLGTPFRGIPKTVEMLAPPSRLGRTALPARRMRELLRTLPGFYDLLPRDRCVEEHGGPRRLDLDDIGRLGGDTELATEAMRQPWHMSNLEALLPRIHTVVGVGQPTVQSVRITGDTVRVLEHTTRLSSDGSPVRQADGTTVRWDAGGDGLVPRASASSPTRADTLVMARHGALLSDPAVLACVRDLLAPNGLEPETSDGLPAFDAVPGLESHHDDGGIGLPARESVSLSLPDVVEAGQRCEVFVQGGLGACRAAVCPRGAERAGGTHHRCTALGRRQIPQQTRLPLSRLLRGHRGG